MITIDPELIELRRVGSDIEIRYAGVHIPPDGHLVGDSWNDENVEELRELQVEIIAERVSKMSAHQQIEVLAAVRRMTGS